MTVKEGQLDKNMFADIAPLDFEVNENGDVKPVQPFVTVKDGFGDIINENDFDINYEGNGAAGEGKVIIKPKANGNFAGSAQIEIPFTIKKKVVTITAGDASSAYNAELSEIAYTVTSNNLKAAEIGKLELRTETTAVKGSPKGTYETNVIFNDDPNYSITVTKGTYTVTDSALTVVAEGYNGVYDGTEHAFGTVTVKTGNLSDSPVVYYSLTSSQEAKETQRTEVPKGKNAGDYLVYYYAVCKNYSDKLGSFTAKIAKAPLKATMNYSGSVTYGDDVPDYTGASLSYDGFKGTDNDSVITGTVTYSSSYEKGKAAGEYELTASGIMADNYDITVVPETLTVQKKKVGFIWPGTNELPYTGSELTYTASIDSSTLISGDAGYVSIGSYSEIYKATAVGEYTSKVSALSGSKAGNYKIDDETSSHQWKIVGSDVDVSEYPVLAITPVHADIYYGENTGSFGYSVVKYANEDKYNTKEGGEAVNDLSGYVTDINEIQYMTTYVAGNNVGTYDIEAYGLTPKDGVQVRIVYEKGKLNVFKATADRGTKNEFTAPATAGDLGMGDGWAYGGTAKTPSVSTSLGGEPEFTWYSKDSNGNYTELSGAPTKPGNYAVKATVPGNNNYDTIESGYDDFTIERAILKVVASDMSSNYGVDINKAALEKTVTGLVDGDQIEIGLTTTANKDVVGDYPITLENVSGNDKDCYTVSFTPGVYSVRSAGAVTVTVEAEDVTYDGKAHSIKVTASDGAEVYYSLTELTASDYKKGSKEPIEFITAGEHTTYYYVAAAGKEGASGSKTFTISKRSVTVTPENRTITYGDPVPTENNMTYVGFVEENTGAATPKYNYSQYDSVGSYTITPVIEDTLNYTFVKNPATLTVNQKTLTFTWSKDAFFFDGAKKTITASTSDLVNNDDVSFIYKDNEASAVGGYTAKVTELTGDKAGNYVIDEGSSSHSWKIVAGDNSFIGKPSINDWTYGETTAVPYAEAKYGTPVFIYSDSEDGEYTETKPSVPGTYYMKAKVEASESYDGLESEPVSFTISKAKLTITADNQFGSQGAAVKELTYKLTGTIAGGDIVLPVITTDAAETSAEGPYAITVSKVKVNDVEYEVSGNTADTPLYVITTADAVYKISSFGIDVKLVDENGNVSSDLTHNYDGKGYGIRVDITGDDVPSGLKVYYSTRKYDNITDLKDAITRGKASENTPYIKDGGDSSIYYYVVDGNNILASDGVTLNAKKASLTIRAKDVLVHYEEDIKDSQKAVTYEGFVGNDNASVLAGTLKFSTDYSAGKEAGRYSITPSGLSSDRYEITFVPGVVKCIVIKDISSNEYKPVIQNVTYTGDTVGPVIKVGSAVLVLGTDYGLVSGTIKATASGEYTAVIRGIGNYQGETTITWKITKKPTTAPKAGEGYTQVPDGNGKVIVTPETGYSIWKIENGKMVEIPSGTAVDPETELYVRKDETTEYLASGYTSFVTEKDPRVSVTLIATPDGKGNVSLLVDGKKSLTTDKETSGMILSGTDAVLKAEAKSGFSFVKWTKTSGGNVTDAGTEAEIQVNISAAVTYTAVFEYVPGEGEGLIPYGIVDPKTGKYINPSNGTEIKTEYDYNGYPVGPGLVDTADFDVSGNVTATVPGTYKTVLTPKEGKVWPDGTKGPKEITWTIVPKKTEYSPTASYDEGTGRIDISGSGTYAGGGPYVYEYQKEGETSWTEVSGSSFDAEADTTYRIRVKGTEYDTPGPVISVAAGYPVKISSNPPSSIGSTEATLESFVTNADTVGEAGFYISKDQTDWTWVPGIVGEDGIVTAKATGLSPDTTYYYKPAVRRSGKPEVIGDVMSFRTNPAETPVATGEIKVNVSAADVTSQYPYTITIERGNDMIAAAAGTTGSSTVAATFSNLPDGNYNVV